MFFYIHIRNHVTARRTVLCHRTAEFTARCSAMRRANGDFIGSLSRAVESFSSLTVAFVEEKNGAVGKQVMSTQP